jgi:Fe-S cluster assembly protein SufD
MAANNGREKLQSAFERRFSLRKDAPWLTELRHSALERFLELGFPTTRHEDWKYTNVQPLGELDFDAPQQNGLEFDIKELLSLSFADGAKNRLVFVDGVYSGKHSASADLPPAMRLQSLAELLRQDGDVIAPWLARYAEFRDRSFVALNTAFMEDGAVMLVPAGCRLAEPIHIVFIATGRAQPRVFYPRNLIVCGERSEVKIVESYVGLGEGVYFAAPVSEIAAAPESIIEHYSLQREAPAAFHIGTISARLERAANFVSHRITLAGALVRNDVYAVLNGEGSDCTLNGLYLTDGDQHVDNHTEIDHAQPRASSRELYKGILRGRARGVFNGKIVVRKAAQKTDARQSNKNLMLSKDAVVNSKPQLEIHADDVKCSHGSTIGQLDGAALFYLRARGIGEHEARSLLSYGFAAEVLSRMSLEPLRARLQEYLLSQFGNLAVVP